MFKFQRIIAGGNKWVDNLFLEDERLGAIGFDNEGLYFNLKRDLTMQELNLLFSQLLNDNPNLLRERIEFRKID
jgi:hypothetical protein